MRPIILEGSHKNKGHYVSGMISRGMLYISGQLPVDPETGSMIAEVDISAHTRMALRNVERVLTAAGLLKNNVVQCRIYIPDVAYWDEVNAVYADFFGAHKPARAIVPSRELHNGALVEIEAIAELEAEE